MRVIQNIAQCRKCKDIIESTHVHDFVFCRCGAIAVDGGHDYAKRTGNLADIIDMTIWAEEEE